MGMCSSKPMIVSRIGEYRVEIRAMRGTLRITNSEHRLEVFAETEPDLGHPSVSL